MRKLKSRYQWGLLSDLYAGRCPRCGYPLPETAKADAEPKKRLRAETRPRRKKISQ